MCGIVYRRPLENKLKRHLNTKIDSSVKKRRTPLSSEVAALLEILGDGEWHGLAELQQQVGLVERKMLGIAAFLCAFDFAVVDEVNSRVRVNRDFREFLARS
jgi:hypothetical protein